MQRCKNASVYDSAVFCLLEAAFKIHLAQKSEGARAPLVSMGSASRESLLKKNPLKPPWLAGLNWFKLDIAGFT